MSRFSALVIAGASALALATVAAPVAAPAHLQHAPTVVAGISTTRIGGGWCC
jgi:hypothetical protein